MSGCGQSGTPEQKFSQGVKQLEQYQYAEADSTFARLGREVPDLPWGMLGQGVSFLKKRLVIDAFITFAKIRELQPQFHQVHPYLAAAYTELQEPGLAAKEYLQILSVEPGNSHAAIAQIESLLGARRYAQARLALINEGQIKRIEPTALEMLHAQYDWVRGAPDSARSRMAKVSLTKGDTTQLRLLANWLEIQEAYDSSMIIAEQLLKMKPRTSSNTYEFLDRANRLGSLATVRRVIPERIGKDTSSLPVVMAWLQHYWARNDYYRADKFTNSLYIAAGEIPSVTFYDIRTRWLSGNKNAAMENVMILNDQMGIRGVSEAIAAEVRGALIILYGHIFEPETDMASLRAAPGWKNDELSYRLREARFFALTRQLEQFDGLINDFLQLHRLESEWVASIGDLYLLPNVVDTVKAKTYFQEALRLNPLERGAFQGLVNIALKGGLNKAPAVYEAYPTMVSSYPTLGIDLAVLLVYLGKIDEAEALFLGRRGSFASRSAIQRPYLDALSRAGRDEPLRRAIAQLVAGPAVSADCYADAAEVYMDDLRFDDAEPLIAAGLALEANYAKLLAMKARIWYAKGQKDQAVKLFDSLIAAIDGDVSSNMYYSQALASDSSNPSRAGNLARHATYMSRQNVRVRANLVEVYMAEGRGDIALVELRENLLLNPDQPKLYFYAAQLLEKESPEEAKRALEVALARGLKEPFRSKAQAMLSQMK